MKPTHIRLRQALKGYEVELLRPTPIAWVCAASMGRDIRPIPRFVSKG